MEYVYIIRSTADSSFIYKGITNNIKRRIDQHNSGKVSSTRNYRPFVLVHVEITKSKPEARELEKFFKSGYGREVVEEIVKNSYNN
jgi:putative endonuclease